MTEEKLFALYACVGDACRSHLKLRESRSEKTAFLFSVGGDREYDDHVSLNQISEDTPQIKFNFA